MIVLELMVGDERALEALDLLITYDLTLLFLNISRKEVQKDGTKTVVKTVCVSLEEYSALVDKLLESFRDHNAQMEAACKLLPDEVAPFRIRMPPLFKRVGEAINEVVR